MAKQNGETELIRSSPEDVEIDAFDEDDSDEENEDGFHDQRMPEQHPAVRTTVQLMGTLGSLFIMDLPMFAKVLQS